MTHSRQVLEQIGDQVRFGSQSGACLRWAISLGCTARKRLPLQSHISIANDEAAAALAASGALPENVNCAVKSSFLLSFLESVSDVEAKLKAPNTKGGKFEDVVKQAQDAAVVVLVY